MTESNISNNIMTVTETAGSPYYTSSTVMIFKSMISSINFTQLTCSNNTNYKD